jgi:hypothetical protein
MIKDRAIGIKPFSWSLTLGKYFCPRDLTVLRDKKTKYVKHSVSSCLSRGTWRSLHRVRIHARQLKLWNNMVQRKQDVFYVQRRFARIRYGAVRLSKVYSLHDYSRTQNCGVSAGIHTFFSGYHICGFEVMD